MRDRFPGVKHHSNARYIRGRAVCSLLVLWSQTNEFVFVVQALKTWEFLVVIIIFVLFSFSRFILSELMNKIQMKLRMYFTEGTKENKKKMLRMYI